MTVTDYGPNAGVYWIGPPRSWGEGRDTEVRLSVVHTTEGHAGATAAEDGHIIDVNRTDGTSTHCFHDSDSSPQEVLRTDTAYAALYHGNTLGVHHELCGTAEWSPAEWASPSATAMLNRCARAQADDCVTFGLQVRRLSPAEVRGCYYDNGPGGICGHVDITQAFPEDQGTHTDPGPNFPWSTYIQLVQGYVHGGAAARSEATVFRYAFGASFTDRPPQLVSPGGPVVVCTDGVGSYFVQAVSYQLNEVVGDAGAPPVVIVEQAKDVHHKLPLWGFAAAFAQLTGGCVFDSVTLAGLAPWRQAQAGGGVSIADVDERIAHSVIRPPTS